MIEEVAAHIEPKRLVVAADGQIRCEHQRFIDRSYRQLPCTIYDWGHYMTVIQRKFGALRNGAPFRELPPSF